MDVLMTILYILLFIVCLSVLIMIHELGHFTAAKVFKVYCLEYSIGFGPALIHKKRKTGETYFSLRVIPFGGYVSMYGEGVELPDGQQVDESRSLEGIKKWKRAIILAAGVTMNAVLALHLFFIYRVAFKEEMCYYGYMQIQEGSVAETAGLKTLDIVALDDVLDESKTRYKDDLHLLDVNTTITYTNATTETVYSYMDLSSFENYKNLKLTKYLSFYHLKDDGEGNMTVDYSRKVDTGAEFVSATINIQTVNYAEDNQSYTLESHPVVVEKDTDGSLKDIGYSLYLQVDPPLPFFKAIGQSFVDFGKSSTMIGEALVTMFTPKTWNSMGGIIAIGYTSTSVLKNFGFGKFLYLWGALSVNLAIVNLLPFPGLDGWQLLVLIIESITKKKIPNKVKTIVSIVGLSLLFIFMGVLLFKDIYVYMIPH